MRRIFTFFLIAFIFINKSAKANETEPNNTYSQANVLVLNGIDSGAISSTGDVDWWKVTTTSDGLLRLTFHTANPADLFVSLYDNNGTIVVGAPVESFNNSTVTLSTDGLAAGTYYVKVNPYSTSSANYGSYTLADSLFSSAAVKDVEPNGTKALALTLPTNSRKTGHVGYYYNNLRDTADWYKVTTGADGLLRVYLSTQRSSTYSNNPLDVNMTLYDNDGITTLGNVEVFNGNGPATNLITEDGLAPGTYYIKIQSYSTNEFADYTISDSLFTTPLANDAEPNSNKSTAVVLLQNSSKTGHVGYYYNNLRDTADWYKVTTGADGLLRVYLSTARGSAYSSNPLDVNMTLYDNDGTTALGNVEVFNSNGPATNLITEDGLAPGTYYIKVQPYSTNEFADYTISDSLFTPPLVNDAEPNGNKATAIILPANSRKTGHVGYYYNNLRDTADWYKVTTGVDGLLRVYLSTVRGSAYSSNPLDVNMTLYDNDGTTALGNVEVFNSNGPATNLITEDGLAPGTYYIKIQPFSTNEFADYTISDSLFTTPLVNDAEPNGNKATAVVLPANSRKTGHVGYYYNNLRDTADWYKVTTGADGLLRVYLSTVRGSAYSSNPLDVNMTLYDNDGTTALGNVEVFNSNGPATNLITEDGLAPGTYYIKVQPYSTNEFADYTISDSLFTTPLVNDAEPNGNKATAIVLPANSRKTGHVGYYYNNLRDTADWYKVTTGADGLLRVYLATNSGSIYSTTSTNPLDVNLTLYDSDATTLLKTVEVYNSQKAATNSITYDGLAAGTYYIKVQSYSTSEFANYTVSDSLLTYNPNDNEPDDSAYEATTIPANRTATGHISFYYNGAVKKDLSDWFKINYTGGGNLQFTFKLLPHLSNGALGDVLFQVYKDTAALPIFNQEFYNSSSSTFSLNSLKQGYYWIKILPYSNNSSYFTAYSITDSFTQVNFAGISLLKVDSSVNRCSSDSLVYLLSGSSSPYTVRLYRDGILSDSLITTSHTAVFAGLNDGIYYATVYSDGATDSAYGRSVTSQLLPPYPTGLTTTNISMSAAKLNWPPFDCVQNYRIQYKVTGSSTWTIINTLVNTVGNYTLTGLNPGTMYTWRVASLDSADGLVSKYSDTATFTTSSALPVTFVTFNGRLNNDEALLNWSTATEINNKGFEVERSMDNQMFTGISFVQGNGNSSLVDQYNFTDAKVSSGHNYYRLKQIDFDGKFNYSSVIRLDYSKFDWTILGNPVINNSWIQLQLDKTSNVSIQIIAMNGNIIQTISKGNLSSGTYSIPLNLTISGTGMYAVRLIVNNKAYTKKIIK